MADKLSKKSAQSVLDTITTPRSPSDQIQSVISLCVASGAETHPSEPAPPPPPAPEPRAEGRAASPADNAVGEGAEASA